MTGLAGNAPVTAGESKDPVFQVNVDLVFVIFSVTDSTGNFVTALKPEDLRITEDGVPQKIVSFAEGAQAPLRLPGSLANATQG